MAHLFFDFTPIYRTLPFLQTTPPAFEPTPKHENTAPHPKPPRTPSRSIFPKYPISDILPFMRKTVNWSFRNTIFLSIILVLGGSAIFFQAPIREAAGNFYDRHLRKPSIGMEAVDVDSLSMKKVSIDELLASPEQFGLNESMLIVNKDYKVSREESFDIVYYKDTDVPMNRAIVSDYARLSAAVLDACGEKMFVMSSVRTYGEQSVLYDEDPVVAAPPGESEHHTGLALDVYAYQFAGPGFLDSPVGKFVNKYCGDYGFIIRYPEGKEAVTNFSYEPWHIRYVGFPHSQYISDHRITLEEYFDRFEKDQYYQIDSYLVSRQDGPEYWIPETYEAISVSPDNTGAYFITISGAL